MNQAEVILDLKKAILDSVTNNKEVYHSLCDNLINEATIMNDLESIAFGYVYKADYYFHTENNQTLMFDSLNQAKKYINEEVPSHLLEKYYTLLRIYYFSYSEIKTSLAFCLKALKISEILNDKVRMCSNLATIGTLYLTYDCYPKALYYLNKASNILDHTNPKNHLIIGELLVSIIDCLFNLDKLAQAKETIDYLATFNLENPALNCYVNKCYMMYYSHLKDSNKTKYYIDKLQQDKIEESKSYVSQFDFVYHLFQSAMRIQDEEQAYKALKALISFTHYLNDSKSLEVYLAQIKFDACFNPTQLPSDYKQYYSEYQKVEAYLNKIRVTSFNAKIIAHETLLKQIEKENSIEDSQQEENIDSLTKLYNNHYLSLKQIAIANDNSNKNISFILFDIDYFKEYNDYYSHSQGDEVLQSVAQILLENRLDSMNVFRYGSDEFVCICSNCDCATVKKYIEKVRSSLYSLHLKHKASACSDRISLSIGYGIHDLPMGNYLFSFIENVEHALYQAKEKGRNSVVSLQKIYQNEDNESQYVTIDKQILSVINDIKSIRFQDLELLKKKCDSLAALAEKNNDLYAMAFSSMYLAHYYQIDQKDEIYKFHSEKAKKISQDNLFLDILIEYHKLACIYFTESGDELSSFSVCLQGLEIAMQALDYEACTAFNNNIAEAFYQSKEFDKAETYFLKALENTSHIQEERPRYKDLVLMNLVDVFVQKKDIKKARYWLAESRAYGQDTSLISTYSKRSEICILVLEDKIQDAFDKIKKLRKELESEEPMLFIHIYLYIMDILLEIEHKEYADWCLHILSSLSNDVNMQFKLQIDTCQVRYCELFNEDSSDAYQSFYETSTKYTESVKITNYESITSLIEQYDEKLNREETMHVDDNMYPTTHIDETTGVYNRRYFSKLLSKYMYNKGIQSLGIILIDIDHFREYNDTYGYNRGNKILRMIAKSLITNLPSDMFVARFGGDQFAIMCTNKNDDEIISYIEKIQKNVQQMKIEHKSHKSNQFITLSFGFYNGANRLLVLDKVNDALSKAKAIGKNTYYPHRQKEVSSINSNLNNTINRRAEFSFIEKFNEVIKHKQTYALVQINIKNFRYYNTKYGYNEGDEILSLIYDTITKWLEDDEYVARIYADNFAVLLKCDGSDTQLHKRLENSIDIFYRIEDPRIHRNLFLSYGIYKIKDKETHFHEAWNAANLVRKETSSPTKRNSSLEMFQPQYQDTFLERIQLEVDTSEAYKNYEFVPFYQPKVDAKTHEIVGAEALLRWYDANGNLVPLYKFLPILNENSYINLIDLSIFDTTCKMLDERIKSGRPVVPISFNISKSYFYDDNLISDYIGVFEKYNIPTHLIEIELMETISLDDTERLKKVIQGFNDYGFKCMLDDFGNGYSSFNVLLNNELSAVKIDRQFFVKNLNGDNKLIIETVVNLIKSLHMKVVAEGVETKEYADFLADCGCDTIQGYYFFKPMPLKKFYTLINRVK